MICIKDECEQRAHRRQMCVTHYRASKPNVSACLFDTCEERGDVARGFCSGHYQQWRAGRELTALRNQNRRGEPCGFPGCEVPSRAMGYCQSHREDQLAGLPMRERRKAARRGAGTTRPDGYRIITVPSLDGSDKGRSMLEHRWVMERMLGRKLLPGENVHHKNNVRTDNRPENLELWLTHQPKGSRVEDLLPWAREIVARYDRMTPTAIFDPMAGAAA